MSVRLNFVKSLFLTRVFKKSQKMAQACTLLWSHYRKSKMYGDKLKFPKHLALSFEYAYPRVINNYEGRYIKFQDSSLYSWSLHEAIFYFFRIFVIVTVINFLIVAYLLTRLICPQAFSKILLKGIECLGPTFIKFGQWMSTRKDLFQLELCDTLTQLQNNVSNHSWEYTKHILKITYGSNWQELFVKFEKLPIGSGCCAQVYKAWIDPNTNVRSIENPRFSSIIETCAEDIVDRIFNLNQEIHRVSSHIHKLEPVAVKVLHPGIIDKLRQDLTIMRIICQCVTLIVPKMHWLSLMECFDEFSLIMENQVNMYAEAKNLIKFANNFSQVPDVIFPHPYNELTSNQILIESFHEGVPISHFLSHNDHKLQRKLAKLGMDTILKMVFTDNFIHCDLHPGNILVQERSASEKKFGPFTPLLKIINSNHAQSEMRLVILDCGLVVSLNERCRENLQDVFRSVLMGDGELAAEYILRHSSQISPDPNGFKTTLGNIVRFHFRNRLNLNNVNVSTVVTELFSAMVHHRVKQDGSFSSVMLSMAVIEGLGRSLDPNIDIVAVAFPFVFGVPSSDDLINMFPIYFIVHLGIL